MSTSIFLARLIGVYLIIACLSLFINQRALQNWVREAIHPLLVFFLGLLDVIIGLIIVLMHNVWSLDWRLLITLIGWILLIRGTIRSFFPATLARFARSLLGRKQAQVVMNSVTGLFLLIGIILTYIGFIR